MLDTTAFTSVAPSASLFVFAASAAAPVSACPVAALLKPSDVADLPYAPSLLLSALLPVSLTTHADFSRGCVNGFDSYAEYLAVCGEDNVLDYVDRFYSVTEVIAEVRQNVLSFLDWRHAHVVPSLSYCVGFMLGWLSALALCQPAEAQVGLLVLEQLAGAALHVRDVYRPMACR